MAVAYCNQMPFNYEDRLIPLDIGARFIRCFTPSLEDLAVMKLYAFRPNDIIDLHSQAFVDRLDWGLLERHPSPTNDGESLLAVMLSYHDSFP